MGNSHPDYDNQELFNQFQRLDWKVIRDCGLYQLWENIKNGEICQAYKLEYVPGQKDMEHYRFRHNNQNAGYFVTIRYVDIEKKKSLCSPGQSYVLTEYIPVKLSDIKQISINQGYCLLRASFCAFNTMQAFHSPFIPNEQLIGLNLNGKPKIWLNKNHSKSQSQNSIKAQIWQKHQAQTAQNVKRIFQMVQQKLISKKFPPQFRDYFYNNNINFFQAYQFVEEFCQKNRFQIPNNIQYLRHIKENDILQIVKQYNRRQNLPGDNRMNTVVSQNQNKTSAVLENQNLLKRNESQPNFIHHQVKYNMQPHYVHHVERNRNVFFTNNVHISPEPSQVIHRVNTTPLIIPVHSHSPAISKRVSPSPIQPGKIPSFIKPSHPTYSLNGNRLRSPQFPPKNSTITVPSKNLTTPQHIANHVKFTSPGGITQFQPVNRQQQNIYQSKNDEQKNNRQLVTIAESMRYRFDKQGKQQQRKDDLQNSVNKETNVRKESDSSDKRHMSIHEQILRDVDSQDGHYDKVNQRGFQDRQQNQEENEQLNRYINGTAQNYQQQRQRSQQNQENTSEPDWEKIQQDKDNKNRENIPQSSQLNEQQENYHRQHMQQFQSQYQQDYEEPIENHQVQSEQHPEQITRAQNEDISPIKQHQQHQHHHENQDNVNLSQQVDYKEQQVHEQPQEHEEQQAYEGQQDQVNQSQTPSYIKNYVEESVNEEDDKQNEETFRKEAQMFEPKIIDPRQDYERNEEYVGENVEKIPYSQNYANQVRQAQVNQNDMNQEQGMKFPNRPAIQSGQEQLEDPRQQEQYNFHHIQPHESPQGFLSNEHFLSHPPSNQIIPVSSQQSSPRRYQSNFPSSTQPLSSQRMHHLSSKNTSFARGQRQKQSSGTLVIHQSQENLYQAILQPHGQNRLIIKDQMGIRQESQESEGYDEVNGKRYDEQLDQEQIQREFQNDEELKHEDEEEERIREAQYQREIQEDQYVKEFEEMEQIDNKLQQLHHHQQQQNKQQNQQQNQQQLVVNNSKFQGFHFRQQSNDLYQYTPVDSVYNPPQQTYEYKKIDSGYNYQNSAPNYPILYRNQENDVEQIVKLTSPRDIEEYVRQKYSNMIEKGHQKPSRPYSKQKNYNRTMTFAKPQSQRSSLKESQQQYSSPYLRDPHTFDQHQSINTSSKTANFAALQSQTIIQKIQSRYEQPQIAEQSYHRSNNNSTSLIRNHGQHDEIYESNQEISNNESDFLDVRNLEKSLDQKYKKQAEHNSQNPIKPFIKASQTMSEDDGFNIAFLDQKLQKFEESRQNLQKSQVKPQQGAQEENQQPPSQNIHDLDNFVELMDKKIQQSQSKIKSSSSSRGRQNANRNVGIQKDHLKGIDLQASSLHTGGPISSFPKLNTQMISDYSNTGSNFIKNDYKYKYGIDSDDFSSKRDFKTYQLGSTESRGDYSNFITTKNYEKKHDILSSMNYPSKTYSGGYFDHSGYESYVPLDITSEYRSGYRKRSTKRNSAASDAQRLADEISSKYDKYVKDSKPFSKKQNYYDPPYKYEKVPKRSENRYPSFVNNLRAGSRKTSTYLQPIIQLNNQISPYKQQSRSESKSLSRNNSQGNHLILQSMNLNSLNGGGVYDNNRTLQNRYSNQGSKKSLELDEGYGTPRRRSYKNSTTKVSYQELKSLLWN